MRGSSGSEKSGCARIGIERAHLEEDTGKTIHVGGGGRIHEANYSLVDYNRAGVPLMEIVSRPDIRSAEQARAYVSELRAVLQAIGASDVKLEEGSMRVDANVSVRPRGSSELGVKVEIKNMNSLRSLGRAIDSEIERQIAVLTSGERLVQETRHQLLARPGLAEQEHRRVQIQHAIDDQQRATHGELRSGARIVRRGGRARPPPW